MMTPQGRIFAYGYLLRDVLAVAVAGYLENVKCILQVVVHHEEKHQLWFYYTLSSTLTLLTEKNTSL